MYEDLAEAVVGAAEEQGVVQAGRSLDGEGQLAGGGVPVFGDALAAPEMEGGDRRGGAEAEELEALGGDGEVGEGLVEGVAAEGSGEALLDVEEQVVFAAARMPRVSGAVMESEVFCGVAAMLATGMRQSPQTRLW